MPRCYLAFSVVIVVFVAVRLNVGHLVTGGGYLQHQRRRVAAHNVCAGRVVVAVVGRATSMRISAAVLTAVAVVVATAAADAALLTTRAITWRVVATIAMTMITTTTTTTTTTTATTNAAASTITVMCVCLRMRHCACWQLCLRCISRTRRCWL